MERLGRVLADHLHQLPLRAALRNGDRHLRPAATGHEPCLQHLTAVRHRRDEHARRDLLALHVELSNERRHQLRAVQVLDPVHDPAATTEHASAANEEHLERGLQVVLGHADHVEVLGLGEDHLLGLHGAAGGGELIPELRRLLVLLALGRLRISRSSRATTGFVLPARKSPSASTSARYDSSVTPVAEGTHGPEHLPMS